MDKNDTITFAVSKIGAGHVSKGTVCQDYSIACQWEDGRNTLLIVCDGHGSSTYVRSDVGSRLAAEITKEKIISFIKSTDPGLFLNSKGQVTARPSINEKVWPSISSKDVRMMDEGELTYHKQNLEFIAQVGNIRKQDDVFMHLFEEIYDEWRSAIEKDSMDHPMSESELKALSGKDIVKAYGTTLMAFVATPLYWFAFHIGDGRLLIADRGLNWMQPVPWDCNCFQNSTTSLCNSNPLKFFRYAFDGTGNFPAAVICCSDGIEDSYGDFELAPYYLHSFYNGLLNTLSTEGERVFLEKLSDFLPKLSAAASKDDMSMAGYVRMDALKEGLEQCLLRAERDSINQEHAERVKTIEMIEGALDDLKKEILGLEEQMAQTEKKRLSLKARISGLCSKIMPTDIENKDNCRPEATDIPGMTSPTADLRKSVSELEEKLSVCTRQDEEARIRKSQLKSQYDELNEQIAKLNEADRLQWEYLVSVHDASASCGENADEYEEAPVSE